MKLQVIKTINGIIAIEWDSGGCKLVIPLSFAIDWLNCQRTDRFLVQKVKKKKTHLLEACFNSHENSKCFLILKNKNVSFNVTQWMSVTIKFIQRKYSVHKLAGSALSCHRPSCRFVKGTRDNFKIHVNFMKPTFLGSLRQNKAYDKKQNMSSCATFRDITR